jgi:hypothetical protein
MSGQGAQINSVERSTNKKIEIIETYVTYTFIKQTNQIMKATVPTGKSRVELWLPTELAEYGTFIAGQYKKKRKEYLEAEVIRHLEAMKKHTPQPTQQKLFKEKKRPAKKTVKKKAIKRRK